MTVSYQDIQAQIRDLTVAAEEARKAELSQALDSIRELIQQYGLTQDDLLGLFKKRRGRIAGAKAAPATKGVAKYRDPETGRTWTGPAGHPASGRTAESARECYPTPDSARPYAPPRLPR